MLAILGLFGAVCAGLLADSVLTSRTDDREGEAEGDALPETAETSAGDEDAPEGDLLDWLDGPPGAGDAPAGPQTPAPITIGAPLAASDTATLDPTNSRDDGPDSSDLPVPADPPLRLEAGPDDTILTGSGAADTILGGAGGDLLGGGGGDDLIAGGAGRDVMHGGAGDDALSGGDGDDTLQGEDGADALLGGAGNDLLAGHEGNDVLLGGAGDDSLLGGMGNDMLDGQAGDDWLAGGGGDDSLRGGPGSDTLDGNDGDDTLFGHDPDAPPLPQGAEAAGANFLNGGAGNDLLWLGANDHGHGGAGADSFHIGDWIGEGGFARIMDFDPAADEIVVIYDAGAHPDPQVSLAPGDAEQDVVVMLDGFPLAQIAGGAGLDVSQLRILSMADLSGPPPA